MLATASDCIALKTERRHDANFVVIGGTAGCHNDNLRCRQCRQSWHHDNSQFSLQIVVVIQAFEIACVITPVQSIPILWGAPYDTEDQYTTLKYHHAPPSQCWEDRLVNTLRPRQNSRHFAADIFKVIFVYENYCILNEISLAFVPCGSINNKPELVENFPRGKERAGYPVHSQYGVSWNSGDHKNRSSAAKIMKQLIRIIFVCYLFHIFCSWLDTSRSCYCF